jgi:hypothetical protein
MARASTRGATREEKEVVIREENRDTHDKTERPQTNFHAVFSGSLPCAPDAVASFLAK